MNKKDGHPALRKWSNFGIKRNIHLILPIIYILVVLISVPSVVILNNDVEVPNYDSYNELAYSKEDKYNIILKKYNLSKNEFNVLKAIVLSEAKGGSYDDAYAVINTIYNRTHAKNWVRSVNKKFGKGKGNSLYYQAISPGQFTVYSSGTYKRRLGIDSGPGYDAIIDFLFSEELLHNYLSFRASSIKVKGSESFSNKGNNYFNLLKDKNRI